MSVKKIGKYYYTSSMRTSAKNKKGLLRAAKARRDEGYRASVLKNNDGSYTLWTSIKT